SKLAYNWEVTLGSWECPLSAGDGIQTLNERLLGIGRSHGADGAPLGGRRAGRSADKFLRAETNVAQKSLSSKRYRHAIHLRTALSSRGSVSGAEPRERRNRRGRLLRRQRSTGCADPPQPARLANAESQLSRGHVLRF